jgi:hypothetical protein
LKNRYSQGELEAKIYRKLEKDFLNLKYYKPVKRPKLSDRKIPISPICLQWQIESTLGVLDAASGVENLIYNDSESHLYP